MRAATVERKTSETAVKVSVNLDGAGQYDISTGVGFLDHMLEQLSRHSLIDLTVVADGDLHIDPHHTTEDTGITIGQAVSEARGGPRGGRRGGWARWGRDGTQARGGGGAAKSPDLVWRVGFGQPRLGGLDTELVKEWFQAFAQNAGITLHVENLYGENSHHICESCYKGLARALREAIEIDPRKAEDVPSTKGVLGGSL